ncbi:MAG TPA: hypothetical protein PLR57_01745, partial [Clostridia bacterium]|nr:hypothetical protein [Clostridia bacterium]
MAKDWIGTNGKCKYCGLDEAHCVCAKPENDSCDITCSDESCSCGHAHESEEHEHGGEGARQFLILGVAAAMLIASHFIGDGFWQTALRIVSYLAAGYEVLLRAGKGLFKKRFFDENVLMSIATIGAIALGDYSEAAAVMIFYGVGESLQELAVRSSRKRISDAVELHPDKARLVSGDEERMVKPEEV